MRVALVLAFALGCGGPSQQQLAETPSATVRNRSHNVEAPAASTSDRDREMAVRQFEDMETAQRAHAEAGQANRANQAPGQGQQPAKTKPGVRVGPLPPGEVKKKGPAEQAPPGSAP